MRVQITRDCLHLPVRDGAPKRRLQVAFDDEVRAFDMEIAEDAPDYWVFMDVRAHRGEWATITAEGLPDDAPALGAITQGDAVPDAETLYREPLRQQFHFSSRRGWNNDPNGLLYYGGQYHLFYQHNPYGVRWGNMHWGHAVSPDLVHWRELPVALYPDALGTMYSGSGVVDWENTAGLQEGPDPTLVLIYTAAGQPFTQCLAYSTDGGATWTKYAGNPVLGHIAGRNRDPKVIWHAPTRRWIMALYLDGHTYALLASRDLKAWEHLQDLELPGDRECPDLFPLPVDGNPANVRWVFWGAGGSYLLGDFDGQRFTPTSDVQVYNKDGNAYAAQTYSDIPAADGRRIQIAWFRYDVPGMPFNQGMTFPTELRLCTTPQGVRLCSLPVREIALLHERSERWESLALDDGEMRVGEAAPAHLRAEVHVGNAREVGLRLHGVTVAYDVAAQTLRCEGREAPLALVDGRLRLEVLLDRTSIEVYAQDGLLALPLGVLGRDEERALVAYARGGTAQFDALEVHALRSAWD